MPYPLYWLIIALINLYMLVVFIWVILSWLTAFNVINPHNQVVQVVGRALAALVEPALGPIRRVLPTLGGLDFSPIVLLLLLQLLKVTVNWAYIRIGF